MSFLLSLLCEYCDFFLEYFVSLVTFCSALCKICSFNLVYHASSVYFSALRKVCVLCWRTV